MTVFVIVLVVLCLLLGGFAAWLLHFIWRVFDGLAKGFSR